MDYNELADKILADAGSLDNVNNALHCMTRVRINVKNKDEVNLQDLKQLDGIIEARMVGNQLQAVLGGNVTPIWDQLKTKIPQTSEEDDEAETAEHGKGSLWDRFVEMISSIFSPVLPAIIGGGLMKGIVPVLTLTGALSAKSDTYTILSIIGDAAFYFLPILIAYSAAKYFKTDIVLSMAVVAALIYPTIATGTAPLKFLGFIPVPTQSYASSLIPAILTVWVLSYVHRFLKKYIPNLVSVLFVPLLTFAIMIPLALAVFGPLGAYVGDLFVAVTSLFKDTMPWLYGAILCGFGPLIIMTGMHMALNPVIMAELQKTGKESGFLVLSIFSNIAMAGAVLGAMLRMKNKKNRSIALGAFIPALFGITEPALYGIALKYKRPLYADMITSGIVGAIVMQLGISIYGFAAPNPFALSLLINPKTGSMYSFYLGLVGFFGAFIVSTVLSFTFGINEETAEEIAPTAIINTNEAAASSTAVLEPDVIGSPVKGEIVPITESKDAVFAGGSMGTGVIIHPDTDTDTVYAPFDGTVIAEMAETRHAIGLRSNKGVELLIHVGLDTVEMKGDGFTYLVKQGDTIKKGQPLMTFDQAKIKAAGFSNEIPVVVTNTSSYFEVVPNKNVNDLTVGDELLYAMK